MNLFQFLGQVPPQAGSHSFIQFLDAQFLRRDEYRPTQSFGLGGDFSAPGD